MLRPSELFCVSPQPSRRVSGGPTSQGFYHTAKRNDLTQPPPNPENVTLVTLLRVTSNGTMKNLIRDVSGLFSKCVLSLLHLRAYMLRRAAPLWSSSFSFSNYSSVHGSYSTLA